LKRSGNQWKTKAPTPKAVGRHADAVLASLLNAIDPNTRQQYLAKNFLITSWHWAVASQGSAHPKYSAIVKHLEQHRGAHILSIITRPTLSHVVLGITDTADRTVRTRLCTDTPITEPEQKDIVKVLNNLLIASSRAIGTHDIQISTVAPITIGDEKVDIVVEIGVRILQQLTNGSWSSGRTARTREGVKQLHVLLAREHEGATLTSNTLDMILKADSNNKTVGFIEEDDLVIPTKAKSAAELSPDVHRRPGASQLFYPMEIIPTMEAAIGDEAAVPVKEPGEDVAV
jgi:hypothetical protein